MPPEFRFECKFCNQPIWAPYGEMGKKVHCPTCKNLVAIPIQTARMQQQTKAAPGMAIDAKEEPLHPVVPKKTPDKRPIQVRYKWEWLKKLVKLVILAAVAFAGYRFYGHYQQQSNKDVETLIREYGEGLAGNDFLVTQRIAKEDYQTLVIYSSSASKEVRALIAECLGKIKLEKGIEPLARLIKDREPTVRKAAAGALSNLRYRQAVELLIGRLDPETDTEVKGEIGYSLRELTGQKPTAGKDDFWKIWWKKEGHSFKIKPE